VSRSGAGRGPYVKGIARRQEIIDVALELLATQGMRASTLQEIATRVGISAPGVLHHFGSKENLLIAVLEERDNRDLEAAAQRAVAQPPGERGHLNSLEAAVARTKASPGLARLYTVLAAEATDPDHPAHEWFRRRYHRIRELTRVEMERAIASGLLDPSVDAEALSQLLPGILDGLQLQWLLDPELDVSAALRLSVTALVDSAASPTEQ
jgi:AcrR family transcriptional regulator